MTEKGAKVKADQRAEAARQKQVDDKAKKEAAERRQPAVETPVALAEQLQQQRPVSDRARGDTPQQAAKARASRIAERESFELPAPKPNPLMKLESGTLSPKYEGGSFPDTFTAMVYEDGTISFDLFGHKITDRAMNRLVFPAMNAGHVGYDLVDNRGDEVDYVRENLRPEYLALKAQGM